MKKKQIIILASAAVVGVASVFCIRPVRTLFCGEPPSIQQTTLHTAQTNTGFTVTEEGVARVYTDYLGYESADSAEILIVVQKDGLDIIREQYTVQKKSHFQTYEYPLYEEGTYHCEVVYTVFGTDGTKDVITFDGDAVCERPAESSSSTPITPKPILPTEEVLYDQNGKIIEKLLIEYDENGIRIRDTVTDGNGLLLARISYHSDCLYPNAYYTLGKLERVADGIAPLAAKSLTIMDKNGIPSLIANQEYTENAILFTMTDGEQDVLLSEKREYDETGTLISATEYDAQGNAVETRRYEYHENTYTCITQNAQSPELVLHEIYRENGLLLTEKTFDQNGVLIKTVDHDYDDGSQRLKSVHYNEQNVKTLEVLYPVPADGLQRTERAFSANGEISGEKGYDVDGNLIRSASYTLGVISYETIYDKDGTVKAQTTYQKTDAERIEYGPNGTIAYTTSYQYDENRNPIQEIRYQGERPISAVFYLADGQKFSLTYTSDGQAKTAEYTDANGVLTQKRTYGEDVYQCSVFRYDDNGRIIEETLTSIENFGSIMISPPIPTFVIRNATLISNRFTNIKIPLMSVQTRKYTYDGENVSRISAYNNDGKLVMRINYRYQQHGVSEILYYEDGSTLVEKHQFLYRANGTLMKKTISYLGADAVVGDIETEYAADGITPTRNITYNTDGRMIIQIKYRADGQIDKSLAYSDEMLTHTTQYSYDKNGVVLDSQTTDRDGKLLSHDVYKNGRIVSEKEWVRQTVITTSSNPNEKSKTTEKTVVRQTTYSYDRYGFLVSKREERDSELYCLTTYQYSTKGILNKKTITVDEGNMISDYDSYGIITQEKLTVTYNVLNPQIAPFPMPATVTHSCVYDFENNA